MTSFAFYRLPYADSYTLIESDQEPLRLDSLEAIGNVRGFVLAPFRSSEDCPALLIRPDSITTRVINPLGDEPRVQDTGVGVQDTNARTHDKGVGASGRSGESSEVRLGVSLGESSNVASEQYEKAFAAFHGAVERAEFRKLVLARKKTMVVEMSMRLDEPSTVRALFERACRAYPRLMVMLHSTPLSGTWLIASPEILIDGKGRSLHTVALAGTMPFQEGHIDWSEKNKGEQHVVEQYIESIVSGVSGDVVKDGPVTMRAGSLVHLRTDFRFHLASDVTLGTLVRQLHPTPAVCGMPKAEASDFISEHEGMDRRYYSGFAGPVDIHGETHLYVALRCAELRALGDTEMPSSSGIIATLYAGGGIMPGSDCQSEWMETESKMKTIKYVLQ